MKSIVDTIRQDHNRVLSGLDDILEREWTADAGTRNRPLELLLRQFLMHTYGEEEILYPLLRDAAPDGVEKAIREHAGIRQLREELLRRWSEEPAWRSLLQKLRSSVADHRDMEENSLLPRLEELFGRAELLTLGSRFNDAKHRTPGMGPPWHPGNPGGPMPGHSTHADSSRTPRVLV